MKQNRFPHKWALPISDNRTKTIHRRKGSPATECAGAYEKLKHEAKKLSLNLMPFILKKVFKMNKRLKHVILGPML